MPHYYDKDCNMYDCTIRTAREENLFPSVTTVLDVLDKPGLVRWKMMNAAEYAFHEDPEKTDVDDVKKEAIKYSNDISFNAAKEGTEIHWHLSRWFKHKKYPEHNQYQARIIDGVRECLSRLCGKQDWKSEGSFCNVQLGYAGQVDLRSVDYVIDFKTQDFDEESKHRSYPDHEMQLAGYDAGSDGYAHSRQLVNIYISRSVPGLVRTKIWRDSKDAYRKFHHLLQYWKIAKNHFPGELEE